ncbi:MAG: hypothetical protein PHX21_04845 [bacterium]|nr:hypothetical protein [bacterium]
MEYKNRHSNNFNWWLIIIFLFPLYLYAIEGNEPEAQLELVSPEIKQKELDTTKIIMPKHLFETYINSKYGNTEYGREYGLALGSKKINKSFELKAEKVEDKSLMGGNIGITNIGRNNLTELKTKAFAYSVENEWYKNCIFDLNEEICMGNNILKTSGSFLYENEVLCEEMVLLGRNLKKRIFIGAGISIPYSTPVIQINWNVNDKLVINSIYNSKKVTTTMENMYITQRNLIIDPDLNHERYSSTAEIKFLFGNNLNTGIKYSEIENKIDFIQIGDSLKPINIYNTIDKWDFNLNFVVLRFRDTISFEYMPTKSNYYLPKLFGKNILAISIPYDIQLNIESKYAGERMVYKYTGERTYHFSHPTYTLPDYWIYNMVIAKEFKNITVWGKISNLTNTKYEILKEVDGYGTSVEAGIKVNI